FLTKPVNDVALFARVKSLVRLKMLTDELRSRASTGERMGLLDDATVCDPLSDGPGKVLLVDDRQSSIERMVSTLDEENTVEVCDDPDGALFVAAESDWELAVVSLSLKNFDGLRLCSQLRSLERTRNLPILILVEPEDTARMLRALDIGVNDYLIRPIDENDFSSLVCTQVRKRGFDVRLSAKVVQNMKLAMTNTMTGLYIRLHKENHLDTLFNYAVHTGISIWM